MLILPKRASTPATPATDKIAIYCNSGEVPTFINDLGATYSWLLKDASTWTPSVSFGGAAVGVTYTTQVGRYFKIDSFVLAWGYCVLSSKGSSTGAATFGTLPFSLVNVANAFLPPILWFSNLTGVSGHLQGFVTPNTQGITLSYLGTGTATTLDNTHFQNTTSFMMAVAYQAG